MNKAQYSTGYGSEYAVIKTKEKIPIVGVFLLDAVHDDAAFEAMNHYVQHLPPERADEKKELEIILAECEIARKEMEDMEKWE